MTNTSLIGYNEWLTDKIEEISIEYYGHPQPNAAELYSADLDFRQYVQEIWHDTCESYDAKWSTLYQ